MFYLLNYSYFKKLCELSLKNTFLKYTLNTYSDKETKKLKKTVLDSN